MPRTSEPTTGRTLRTVFVGDVHGCLQELEELLVVAAVGPGDRVVLVGDMTAKGPDSVGVVELARARGFGAVLGNHDAKVLALLEDPAEPPGRGDHAQVARALSPGAREYLRSLPLYLELGELGVVVVHGGLVPGIPLAQQEKKFLLNLRSITPAGTPSKRVDDGVPWASLWKGPAHVVFGHDAVRGLQQHPFATGLDTGCVYGGKLTALVYPEKKLMSVQARHCYSHPG
jgi:diadenosine tetraphosphatase ApaH/serine/threonine PP2A family protein phosphatase